MKLRVLRLHTGTLVASAVRRIHTPGLRMWAPIAAVSHTAVLCDCSEGNPLRHTKPFRAGVRGNPQGLSIACLPLSFDSVVDGVDCINPQPQAHNFNFLSSALMKCVWSYAGPLCRLLTRNQLIAAQSLVHDSSWPCPCVASTACLCKGPSTEVLMS